jgi:signal transduction histidine kinase
MRHLNPGYGQFRWMVLLLVVAVILPTVCLLWFMSEVVKNERLAVRQKLTTVYKERLAEVTGRANARWADHCRHLERRPSVQPYRQFVAAAGQGGYDALMVFDDTGRRLYPSLSTDAGPLIRPSEIFADAWEMEFVNGQYEQAAERYEEYARISDDHGRLAAYIGKSRALARLGNLDQAVTECRLRAAFSPLAETGDSRCLALIASARLLLLSWTQDKPAYTQLHEETFRKLLAMLYRTNGAGHALSADENLFLARKVLELGRQNNLLARNDDLLRGATLEQLIEAEERSIRFAEQFPTVDAFDTWLSDTLQPIDTATGAALKGTGGGPPTSETSDSGSDPNRETAWPAGPPTVTPRVREPGPALAYGIVHRTGRATCAALLSSRNVIQALADYADGFQGSDVDYRILDESGRRIVGTEQTNREPFVAGLVGEAFPDWTVQLFFKDSDVFKRAADEQIAIYTWTGLLVIMLILVSGAVAAKSIGKQVKLNRLKNDFIATVTHELKTPLASMRVLVDTLLEGGPSGPQDAGEHDSPPSVSQPQTRARRDPKMLTEYLQLISKENERLSRLIDNFLTFSRMERNKQAFQMRQVSPVSIARTAAEAVKTKLGRGNCLFETDIPDELPEIKADHDALVTVLVNLLDNAYKYSYDEKRVKLSVTTENASVCFRVSDNGLGIPRRALKKVFRRFYQVDRSLTRRAEGCGLGLSIAKFIVDAHGGTISVESKPGQGSTFTVTVPAAPA